MADSFTPNLNLRKPEVGAADDTWGGTSGLNTDLDLLDALFNADGSGTAVSLHVGSRTLPGGTSPTAMMLKVDGGGQIVTQSFQFQDATDPTKRMTLLADALVTGANVQVEAPPASGTMATQQYVAAQLGRLLPTGTVQQGYYGATPPAGWLFADGRTIGDAGSGATNLADPSTQALFTVLWGFNDNVRFPVLPSRGASASADWTARKQITLPDHSGRVMAGRDNLSGTNRGNLSVVIPNSSIWGATGGAQQIPSFPIDVVGLNTLNFGAITSTVPIGGTHVFASGGGGDATGWDHIHQVTVNGTFGITASGTVGALNTVQPTIMVDVVIKL